MSADGLPLRTTTGLEPYVPTVDAPWDLERAYHLLARVGFGASRELATELAALAPQDAVEALVERAVSLAPFDAPPWVDASIPPWDSPEFIVYNELQEEWNDDYLWEIMEAMLGRRGGSRLDRAGYALREKLALFWSNHFVTAHSTYWFAPFVARYWGLMRRHALGDFRQFVHDVGLTPAMLIYLNGQENRRGSPNENYARELLELFTMGLVDATGQPTYAQADVRELARALTGWYVDYQGDLGAHLHAPWHDTGQKTIFGQRGRWGYDDVVPLLFGARGPEIARFICRKLYRAFVYDAPDEAVVEQMAALLLAENFQLRPVVRALLGSAHFFDAEVMRARIKSPAEALLGTWATCGTPVLTQEEHLGWLWWQATTCGQQLLEPPDVAGWPGGRAWIDTAVLPMRWLHTEHTLWYGVDTLPDWALTFPQPFNASAFVTHVTRLLLGRTPTPAEHAVHLEVLLNGLPAYEWNPTADGARYRIRALLSHLLRLPEAQLA